MLELLPSPWLPAFNRLLRAVTTELTLVSPFISRAAANRVTQGHSGASNPELSVHVITDLSVSSLLEGTLDPAALLDLMDAFPASRVSVAPRLHAKAYIADTQVAIVTSANLTEAGLLTNKEYGITLLDEARVTALKRDLCSYAELGNRVPRERLQVLSAAAREIQSARKKLLSSARRSLHARFAALVEEATTEVLRAHAAGKTTHGIFCDTVLYLLSQHGPLSTQELHPLVQRLHPELCDDSVDRVIEGVRFGKRWKHYVRNAQQALKRKSVIALDGRAWRVQ